MVNGNSSSQYFDVQGRGKKPYQVTINYEQHHWCSCRGMISKKGSWGEDTGKTQGTSCKHIKQIIETKFGGDWGTKNKDGSRTPKNPFEFESSTPVPSNKPTGRRAAIMATRAKLAKEVTEKPLLDGSLQDRIAALESAR